MLRSAEREKAAARDVLPWHVGVRQQRGACLAALRPGSPHLGPGLLLSLLIISSGLEILVIACKLPDGGSCGAVRRLVLRPVCLPSSGNLVGTLNLLIKRSPSRLLCCFTSALTSLLASRWHPEGLGHEAAS